MKKRPSLELSRKMRDVSRKVDDAFLALDELCLELEKEFGMPVWLVLDAPLRDAREAACGLGEAVRAIEGGIEEDGLGEEGAD